MGAALQAIGLDDVVDRAGMDGAFGVGDEIRYMITLAAGLVALAAPVLLAARLAYARPVRSFLWPGRRFSLRHLGLGAGTHLAAMITVTAVGWVVLGRPALPAAPLFWSAAAPVLLLYLAVATGLILIAAAAEEVVFRGVVLQASAGFIRHAWVLCLLNGVLFAAIHMDPDPVAFLARAASGAVWAWAALRLGGLEFAIGGHWAGNLVMALTSDFAASVQPGRGFGLDALVMNLAMSLVVLAAIEWVARRRSA